MSLIQREPCPFCASADGLSILAEYDDDCRRSFWVACGFCDAHGPVAFSDEVAVQRWNERNDGKQP